MKIPLLLPTALAASCLLAGAAHDGRSRGVLAAETGTAQQTWQAAKARTNSRCQ